MMHEQDFEYADLLTYLRSHTLAVVATNGPHNEPQAALVGVACTDTFEIVFDTLSTTRKHRNLQRDDRIAIAFNGPDEKTVQLEGLAIAVSLKTPEDATYREAYYRSWPCGRDRLDWPDLGYWRVVPVWARYSDFARGPLIREFRWPLQER
jgi:general stress protein 26